MDKTEGLNSQLRVALDFIEQEFWQMHEQVVFILAQLKP